MQVLVRPEQSASLETRQLTNLSNPGTDVWQRLQAGLEQWFQATSAFLNCLASGRRIPTEIERLLSRIQQQQLHEWRRRYCLHSHRPVTWAWPAAVDVQLHVDGSLQIMDCDFSVPSGLDRLCSAGIHSASETRALILNQLFGCGQNSWSGRRAVLLDPDSTGTSRRSNEFLSWLLDVPLVTATELAIDRNELQLQTGRSHQPVDVIIRRVDDDLLDPNCGRPDSLTGVPGIVKHWQEGKVSILNPPGTGLLRHRSMLSLIPECIRIFHAQQPLLDLVPTLSLERAEVRAGVFRDADHYAIRPDDPLHPARPWFGGSTDSGSLDVLRQRVEMSPARWVARPLQLENSGRTSLRLFGTLQHSFRLLPAALMRPCEPDGGAATLINSDTRMAVVWQESGL